MRQPRESKSAIVRRLLTTAVRDPAGVVTLPERDLDLLLRLARRVRLLGRLADRLARHQLLAALPSAAREQLESSLVVVQARSRATRWELSQLAAALRASPAMPVVVLKGCAYLAAEMPNAPGRLFADVDLLFAEPDLEVAERRLVSRGWQSTKLDPYDQHYYRVWTHELPPLVHAEREVEADLHHNIVPRTGRLKPSAALLLEDVRQIEGESLYRLGDCDVVLHAMTHLMFDSDMADCLRDLVDIDELCRYFSGSNAEFWGRLWARASELDLTRPAFYALRYANSLLGTPVPDAVLRRSHEGAPWQPIVWLMDRLVPLALFAIHPDLGSRRANAARFLLYVRSVWIRMPPLLLARHLAYKFYVRRIKPSPTRPKVPGSGSAVRG
jgi:hypothetical protein